MKIRRSSPNRMSSRWNGPRQGPAQCVQGTERRSKELELREQGEEWREMGAERPMEQDLVGFTDPNKKCVSCSDCNGKSLDGFKQVYII